ncbi:hypothetical protein [Actinosynnema sp. NPDC020468]|uniref:hypothetical protein n=1 Tax=Actinosynnema sp. NPDC020468 TaxID=3154488 RepID=UPI0034099512
MSPHRTRGLLRAAALLVVGASPLAAGAASATPLDHAVEPKLGSAPEVNLEAAKAATNLLDTRTVTLPRTEALTEGVTAVVPQATAPQAQLPQLPQLPQSAPLAQLPHTPQARDLGAPGLPVGNLPAVPGLGSVGIPELGALPALPALPQLPLG